MGKFWFWKPLVVGSALVWGLGNVIGIVLLLAGVIFNDPAMRTASVWIAGVPTLLFVVSAIGGALSVNAE